MQEQTFKAGELIFREGEDSDLAYLIVSGRVDIFKRMENGATVLLATLGDGEIFGEMGIISEQPRTASAAANTLLTVKIVTRDAFANIVAGQPEEVRLVFRGMMERLRETNQKLTQLAGKHAQFQLSTPNASAAINQVTLIPMTNELKTKMSKSGMIVPLPFRVGSLPEGAQPNALDCNNLFLEGVDTSVMSRNHFAIQRAEHGLMVVDRGSKLGTIVNGKKIGGGAESFNAELHPGDNEIIAGDEPYRFCVNWQ